MNKFEYIVTKKYRAHVCLGLKTFQNMSDNKRVNITCLRPSVHISEAFCNDCCRSMTRRNSVAYAG